MERTTRASSRGKAKLGVPLKITRETLKKNEKVINSELSSDSDSGSEGEFDDLVTETLKDFMSQTTDDVDSNSDTDSDGSDSGADISENNLQRDGFIVDKRPDLTTSLAEERHVGVRNNTPSENVSDNGIKIDINTVPLTNPTNKTRRKGDTNKNVTENKKKDNRYELITELDPGINVVDTYINVDAFQNPQACMTTTKSDLLKGSVVDSEFEKKVIVPPYEESLNQMKKQRRAERAKTNGKGWFNMPVQEMTEEKKNDLMVLQMRRSLDPKRFYKGPDIRALPKFFQMGRVVEGPADFYHSRIPKKQRKSTLVDELMADAEFRKYNKRKYAELVEQKKVSGAHKHMRRLKKRKR